ncbi:hypothetical protein [Actinoplanes couchii]|uniref:DUF2029 domain-containing protein n=1 Tax=Actinoplanes couchii TaxID=403638 RepID=A0ABQ3X9B4_9ACTN|nr:hypothetical protein [Actinoplanes couchii]MDR6325735.1 Flp pilus assembly protein TadB [Actinoplanes couchii]GID55096.1 hypothetical protein Aco03nite_035000 [Actinoplanes couchii]
MTTTLLDRFADWNLDHDGDLYGDERERTRWYEGIAVTWQTQMILVPWTITVLVWVLGGSAVLPLAITLAVLLAPLSIMQIYVARRRVEVTPRVWTTKRKVIGLLSGAPYVLFMIGVAFQLGWPQDDSWISMTVGALIGLAFGVVMQARASRKRRLAEAAIVADED